MKCRKCGAELADGVSFCRECGTKVEPIKKYCRECGAVLGEEMKFCPNCGAKIEVIENVSTDTMEKMKKRRCLMKMINSYITIWIAQIILCTIIQNQKMM